MRKHRDVLICLLSGIVGLLVVSVGLRGADTLPAQIPDDAYWKLIVSASESDGTFPSDNLTSNENAYQRILPELSQAGNFGGVYLGVGPEQNFTYIIALKPKLAFVVDIRRQNLLEHLVYKGLFELSASRVEFLSRLFGRTRPDGVQDTATIDELLAAYATAPRDDRLYTKTVQDLKDLLVKRHGFRLGEGDQAGIEHVYTVFFHDGPRINYDSTYPVTNNERAKGGGRANFVTLMTATDSRGDERGFLASEDNFRVIKDFESRNLLIPLVGDFGGTKALRAVGQYLREHGALVAAFYTSNVEQYLFRPGQGPRGRGVINGGAANFYSNVASLPLDANSVFIRSNVPGNNVGSRGDINTNPAMIAPIQATVDAINTGEIRSYNDLLRIRK